MLCDAGYIHDEAKLDAWVPVAAVTDVLTLGSQHVAAQDQGGTKEECCVKSCELFSCAPAARNFKVFVQGDADGFAIPAHKRKQSLRLQIVVAD